MSEIWVEVPDKELRVANPTAQQLSQELLELKYYPRKDNCLDLCKGSGFLQAIKVSDGGFLIRFNTAEGAVLQSAESQNFKKTERALLAYLADGTLPQNSFSLIRIKATQSFGTVYRKLLLAQAGVVLFAGIFTFKEELALFLLLGTPFVVLAIFLALLTVKSSFAGEISSQQFWRQLTGGFAVFIPYYWFALKVLFGGNAPQGPGIFLFPVSIVVLLPVFYGAGYYISVFLGHVVSRKEQQRWSL